MTDWRLTGGNYVDMSKSKCWECRNATGGCSWSESLTPVNGWFAVWDAKHDTWDVRGCPEFERDALRGGLVRYVPPKE